MTMSPSQKKWAAIAFAVLVVVLLVVLVWQKKAGFCPDQTPMAHAEARALRNAGWRPQEFQAVDAAEGGCGRPSHSAIAEAHALEAAGALEPGTRYYSQAATFEDNDALAAAIQAGGDSGVKRQIAAEQSYAVQQAAIAANVSASMAAAQQAAQTAAQQAAATAAVGAGKEGFSLSNWWKDDVVPIFKRETMHPVPPTRGGNYDNRYPERSWDPTQSLLDDELSARKLRYHKSAMSDTPNGHIDASVARMASMGDGYNSEGMFAIPYEL